MYQPNETRGMHRDYLERLGSLHQSIDGVCDVLAYIAMLAASWGSLLLAILNPLWIVDSALLNTAAFFEDPNQTIFLRRVLMLEVRWPADDESRSEHR